MDRLQKIQEALTRGVENIYPDAESLEKVLCSRKKLKIYFGIDPTGKLHIGHSVSLLKLRQFQELGHTIILLIGDFTARIGDPTDKMATRKALTHKQVLQNAKGYKRLIGKILDTRKTQFFSNSTWNDRLAPQELMQLFSLFTVQRLLERDMFQKRLAEGKDIHVHEFVYPIFQAYDSVAMDVDMEIGGSDQTFNMLAGRTLMRKMRRKEKFVLTMRLFTDPQGKKMSATERNLIALDESPQEIYGKVMSWPDSHILSGFELLTTVPLDEIRAMQKEMKEGKNPKAYKMRLARTLVEMYHGTQHAERAERHFRRVFEQKQTPSQIAQVAVKNRDILSVLVESGLASSKSEARRLIQQKGVKVNGKVVFDEKVSVAPGSVVQRGKRFFRRIL